MDGLLGSVYSFGDRLKKRARGLLNDPVHQVQANMNAWAGDTLQAMQSPEGMAAGLLGMAPIGMAGTFAGVKAKTADVAKLAQAEAMEKAGAPRDEIWSATGWFKGPDKKWRFEIDDSGMKLNLSDNGTLANQGGFLDQYKPATLSSAGIEHPELYAAYPSINSKTMAEVFVSPEAKSGSHIADLKTRGVSVPYERRMKISAKTPEDARSAVGHEFMHDVQKIEGFPAGSSPERELEAMSSLLGLPKSMITPEELKMAYMRRMGEAEARAVQARINMSKEQRAATPPWESYDMPWGLLR